MRCHGVVAAAAAAGLALMAWLGLADFAFNDYDTEASTAVRALTEGHVGQFLHLAPGYGGSLAIRAPFALAPSLWGGGELADYRVLALPCLLSVGALAVWVAARMRGLGKSSLARGATIGLFVGSPLVLFTLEIGHPEEMLGGSLCVAALLTARAGRANWTGALLGLAVANKSWALIAVLPVLAAMPGGRRRAAVVAAGVAAAVLAPFLIAAHLGGRGASGGLGAQSGPIFEPPQLLWWLGGHGIVRGGNGLIKPGFRVEPHWLSAAAHPLVVAVSAPLTLLWLRRRQRRPLEPLALLTLVLLLRCALDPWNDLYYAVPFFMALYTWDALSASRAPAIPLVVTVLCYLTWREVAGLGGPDVEALFYASWVLPLIAAISLWLYAPAWVDRVTARLTRRAQALPDVDQLLGEAA